jgi:hypothetical protein
LHQGRANVEQSHWPGFAWWPAFSLIAMAAGPNLEVRGSGTIGLLAKWTGITSSNSIIGDSSIFEDKFGKVGMGTDSPTLCIPRSRFRVIY